MSRPEPCVGSYRLPLEGLEVTKASSVSPRRWTCILINKLELVEGVADSTVIGMTSGNAKDATTSGRSDFSIPYPMLRPSATLSLSQSGKAFAALDAAMAGSCK